MLVMDAWYLQQRLPPDARVSMTPSSRPASRFAKLALSRESTTSTKREEIPVPIGGSFVVAAPLGLHTVKLLLQAPLACKVSSHAITCAKERRSKAKVCDGSITIAKVVERLNRGQCRSKDGCVGITEV